MTEDTTKTVGCDIGDKYSHLCVLEGTKVVDRGRVVTSRAGFRRWFGGKARCTVALEAGTHSRWISEQLEELGHEVLVANPRQVRLIYAGKRKNDQLDAESLARLARVDRHLLCPIRHRSAAAHADLSVLRGRDQLVVARTALINHVRGVAKGAGVRVAKCESRVFPRRARAVLPEELVPALEPLLNSIEHLSEQIGSMERRLEQMLSEHPKAQVLTTIAGVGALTAMAYVLTLEDPSRFEQSREVAAFLGLVPRQRQSGGRDPELRISKAGDPFVRRLLVQCAHHILGPHGRDSELRRFGLRLLERGGKRAKKKAVIAVARKLAILMHRMWESGESYEPLPQPAAAEAA